MVLFDFDGVLSKSRFYTTIKDNKLKEKVRNKIFSKDYWPIVSDWMRGKLSYQQIHRDIAPELNIQSQLLDQELINSAKLVKIDKNLVRFALELKKNHVKTAIFTDNMDVFDQIIVKHNNLDRLFDLIISSSAYGALKTDNSGELLKKVIKEQDLRPEEVLLVDDSENIGKIMKSIGGSFYLFSIGKNAADLEIFYKELILP